MLYFLKNQQKNIFQGLPQEYEERNMEQNKCAVTIYSGLQLLFAVETTCIGLL